MIGYKQILKMIEAENAINNIISPLYFYEGNNIILGEYFNDGTCMIKISDKQ